MKPKNEAARVGARQRTKGHANCTLEEAKRLQALEDAQRNTVHCRHTLTLCTCWRNAIPLAQSSGRDVFIQTQNRTVKLSPSKRR
jgi:hypothetical protein